MGNVDYYIHHFHFGFSSFSKKTFVKYMSFKVQLSYFFTQVHFSLTRVRTSSSNNVIALSRSSFMVLESSYAKYFTVFFFFFTPVVACLEIKLQFLDNFILVTLRNSINPLNCIFI